MYAGPQARALCESAATASRFSLACRCVDTPRVVSTHLLFGCFYLALTNNAAVNIPIKLCKSVFVSPG